MAIPKSIRVRLDGDAAIGEHVEITDGDTGRPIEGVVSVEIKADACEVPQAILRFWAPQVDLVATVREAQDVCPHCGKARVRE